MALITLTDSITGKSFSLDQEDIIKIYTKGSQTIIEYSSGNNSRTIVSKIDGTAANTALLATNLVSTTYKGVTVYLNNSRIVNVTEVSSKAWVIYNNNGTKPETLKLDVDQSTFESGIPNRYKEYMALLTQSGTDDPTVTIIKNELSGDVSWTRNATGIYDGTLVGEFLNDTTGVISMTASPDLVTGARFSDDVVRLRVKDPSTTADIDGKLTDSLVRIVVKT